MNQLEDNSEQSGPSFGVSDVLFIIFRHKWKILIFGLLGIIAGGLFAFIEPPVYVSQAKLLVRYVVDTSAIDSYDQSRSPSGSYDSIINTEVEILTSWDLAVQVADAIPTEKLLLDNKKVVTKVDAARAIVSSLKVTSIPGNKVIWVSFEHRDPAVASLVLTELIKRYLEMHLEVHRPSGGFEYLTQQSDQMRLRLSQTEEQLKALKAQAGITSLDESTTALSSIISKQQNELSTVEAELAGEQAQLADLQKSLAQNANQPVSTDIAPPSAEISRNYRAAVIQLEELQKVRLGLSATFTPESRQMKVNEQLCANVRAQCQKMEHDYPGLLSEGPSEHGSGGNAGAFDLASERSQIAALEAKAEVLRKQEKESEARMAKVSDAAVEISQLERRKKLEEENARYVETSLEKARVDETLNPAKMPNINVVQKPSPGARKAFSNTKSAGKIAGAGLFLGLALAALYEFVLDKTVKRSSDIEGRVRVPLTMTIPYMGGTRKQRVNVAARAEVAPWDAGHFLRIYCDAIRDRLELYFQVMTHKPKLLAVAGLSTGAGTSTLAAGLAAALSQTADGKVLYVDMNAAQTNLHPFLEGRPALPLDAAIELDRPFESAANNLYLATGTALAQQSDKPLLKRFYNLIPLMKGSDFDYIVFDLPPFSETSPSIGLAGFMDLTLLVVEAERDREDVMKRVCHELGERRSNVSIILNKAQTYLPAWAA